MQPDRKEKLEGDNSLNGEISLGQWPHLIILCVNFTINVARFSFFLMEIGESSKKK